MWQKKTSSRTEQPEFGANTRTMIEQLKQNKAADWLKCGVFMSGTVEKEISFF
jgi:hypothetical protein